MADMTFGQMREHAEKHGGFTLLPADTYNMVIVSADTKEGSTGVLQIMARFEVLDGPLVGKGTINRFAPYKNDGDPNGMFFAQLSALGLPPENPIWGQVETLDYESGVALIASAMLGLQGVVQIVHTQRNNQTYDNVKSIKPIGVHVQTTGTPAPVPVAQTPTPITQGGAASPSGAPAVATPPVQPVAAPVAAASVQPVTPVPVAVVPVTELEAGGNSAPASVVVAPSPVLPVAAAPAPELVVTEPADIMPAPEATPAETPEAVVADFPTPPNSPF